MELRGDVTWRVDLRLHHFQNLSELEINILRNVMIWTSFQRTLFKVVYVCDVYVVHLVRCLITEVNGSIVLCNGNIWYSPRLVQTSRSKRLSSVFFFFLVADDDTATFHFVCRGVFDGGSRGGATGMPNCRRRSGDCHLPRSQRRAWCFPQQYRKTVSIPFCTVSL